MEQGAGRDQGSVGRSREYWSMCWALNGPQTYVVKSQRQAPKGHTGRREKSVQSPLDGEEMSGCFDSKQ